MQENDVRETPISNSTRMSSRIQYNKLIYLYFTYPLEYKSVCVCVSIAGIISEQLTVASVEGFTTSTIDT